MEVIIIIFFLFLFYEHYKDRKLVDKIIKESIKNKMQENEKYNKRDLEKKYRKDLKDRRLMIVSWGVFLYFTYIYFFEQGLGIGAKFTIFEILAYIIVSVVYYKLVKRLGNHFFKIEKPNIVTEEDIKERIKQSGKEGERQIQKELNYLIQGNQSYQIFNNIKLRHQEFDVIFVTDKAIFNIEVKNMLSGTELVIDEEGNWVKHYKHKPTEIMDNPIAQVKRHNSVLKNVFGNKYPIVDVLVIANENIILKGSNNTTLNVMKKMSLNAFIEDYECEKRLTNSDILAIVDTIKTNSSTEENSINQEDKKLKNKEKKQDKFYLINFSGIIKIVVCLIAFCAIILYINQQISDFAYIMTF